MCIIDEGTWVGPVDGSLEPHTAQSFFAYFGHYLQDTVTHSPVPKVGMGALVAVLTQTQAAFGVPFWFLLGAWSVDWAAGVLRTIADPKVKLRADKARNGVLKLLVIFLVVIMAAFIEGMTFEIIGWDPAGKLVMTATVGMFWEEAVSFQRNAQFFVKSAKLRFKSVPWLGGGNGGADK